VLAQPGDEGRVPARAVVEAGTETCARSATSLGRVACHRLAPAAVVIISQVATYDLGELGWLLFERLATDAIERRLAVPASAWQGSCDGLREALWDDGLPAVAVRGPVVLRMVWVRRSGAAGASAVADRLEEATRRAVERDVVLVVNLDEEELSGGVAAGVLGRRWLSAAIESSGALRLAHPSALGVRSGGPCLPNRTASFDAAAAVELARVFVPVGAHRRALRALQAHRFVVLTGPPEMGKTAIARTIALALASDGWEAHDCIRPEDVWRAWRPERRQVFVADDAFGSTEYRPDAGERWAREMERLLRSLDAAHWLIWTSRPAPLHAGLARIHRERGAERYPHPGEVVVDAGALDRAEKALILLRHAKAAGASRTAARVVRTCGDAIVEDPHFTPERIRRFAAGRLFRLEADPTAHAAVRAIVREELREPTAAMAASLRALDRDHRAVLVALLDCAPGPVAERDLAAAARRHADGGLPRSPAELTDRLADHFLRVADTKVTWVHPSWRDLVIEQLTADAAGRRAFLARAGVDGLLLALSVAGGRRGERLFPLLVDDGDWDVLGDRLVELARRTDDHDTLRLLAAVRAAFDAGPPRSTLGELRALADALLGTVRRRVDRADAPTAVASLAAWLDLADQTGRSDTPRSVDRTWFALLPGTQPVSSDDELRAADDWLWLVEVLHAHRPKELDRLGFPRRHKARLASLAVACEPSGDDDTAGTALRDAVRLRLARLPLPYPVVRAPAPEAPAPTPATRRSQTRASAAGTIRDDTVARILRDL
jgi:hypothetical protein